MSSSDAINRVGLILLAAGESSRLGQPKQLLTFRGVSLLRHTALEAVASDCKPVVVALGSQAARMQCELANLPVDIAVNDRWQAGIGSSLKLGLSHLLAADQDIAAALIMVCDQPFVDRALLTKLLQAHAAGADRAACAYGQTLGVPALFSRAWFSSLASLDDSEGAKKLLIRKQGQGKIARIAFPQGEIDLDTSDDYERFVSVAHDGLRSRKMKGESRSAKNAKGNAKLSAAKSRSLGEDKID